MATTTQVTFDAANPDGLAKFWCQVLGYKIQDPPEGFSSWPEFLKAQNVPESEWDSASAIVDPQNNGPRLYFQKVTTPKQGKNRVHLDVTVSAGHGAPLEERRKSVEAAVEPLVAAGAKKVRAVEERGEFWIVMQDPEGNEFCLQ